MRVLVQADGTSSLVIEHIKNTRRTELPSHPKVGVAYVYFDYKDRARQTPEVILAEMIKQLEFERAAYSPADVSLSPHIKEMYDNLHHQGKRPTLSELRELILSIGAEFGEVHLIFDALDECNEDERKVLLPFMTQLPLARKGNLRFKIMVTGRPYYADMLCAFADAAKLAIVPDEEDMKLAIREKIEAEVAKKRHKISPQLKADIISTVLKKADRM